MPKLSQLVSALKELGLSNQEIARKLSNGNYRPSGAPPLPDPSEGLREAYTAS
jgi:hypothetical protein